MVGLGVAAHQGHSDPGPRFYPGQPAHGLNDACLLLVKLSRQDSFHFADVAMDPGRYGL